MLLKEIKELVLLGHDRLEPAKHGLLAPGIDMASLAASPTRSTRAGSIVSRYSAPSPPSRREINRCTLWNPTHGLTMLDRTENLAALAENWLMQFELALARPSEGLLQALFHPDSYWRDVLALTWDIGTVKGADAIVSGLRARAGGATGFRLGPDRTPPRHVTRAGTPAIEAIFQFETT